MNDSAGGVEGHSAIAYDAAGRLMSQSEPTGTVSYSRDALGRWPPARWPDRRW